MNKVVTVNLSGNAYQLDEDGYNALRVYLDRAEAQLRDSADRREVIADLEQAIAEKCASALRPHKNVVTAEEMTQILNAMGPVQTPDGRPIDIGSSNAQSETRTTSGQGVVQGSARQADSQRRRRLYRLNEGAKWAGVCAGLAAFSDINVYTMRGLFALFTVITPFVGLFIYLILMFILPVAYTEEEIAAAHARPPMARCI